jgi:F-type H+-transporting ATPase subunit delta
MKITPAQYAKTLFGLTEDQSPKEIDAVVASFAKLLNQNRQLKLAPKVMAKFNEIWNEKNGIVEAEVISREKLSSQLVNKLNSFIGDKYKAKKVVLNEVIDEKIQGGIVIKVGDEVMDGSVQAQLNNLRNILIK